MKAERRVVGVPGVEGTVCGRLAQNEASLRETDGYRSVRFDGRLVPLPLPEATMNLTLQAHLSNGRKAVPSLGGHEQQGGSNAR